MEGIDKRRLKLCQRPFEGPWLLDLLSVASHRYQKLVVKRIFEKWTAMRPGVDGILTNSRLRFSAESESICNNCIASF